ncbi:arginine biosynthesis ArgJ, mitochondrial [Capronia coronata CBS 617.96]|uniref:Arginine biosynthesis bifunctional protein ArgJ, mitochondrial n=1 Tax=Capronia coronata CBS 617.96 TaxID=1182541 RepID=W9YN69_9EURO|nr:arginine biosynthesis ArgJ, mitochondrial [Capronia coronata CBS 617.96]EXJ83714.1 arginine biosynthesis ArgJ, mitochondrial [Capronia coronata CBS 617.96]
MPPPTMSPSRSFIRNCIRHYSAPVDSSIPASKQQYIPTSGTYPKGFKVSGTHVGVKPANKSHPDLALIASDRPAFGAAVFTTNKFQAAPVQVSRSVLEKRGGTGLRSIIINSGCANAVTGAGGLDDAKAMAETASAQFQHSQPSSGSDADNLGPNSLVMSTGVIGQRLPIQKILAKIPTAYANLDDSHTAWLTTAKAICTTDTFPKLLSTTFTLPSTQHRGIEYRLAGMTKGAGMIHPNMATLLGILCTDAPIGASALKSLLTTAVNQSFNCISIDGDTSTNDTVAILANGAAAAAAAPQNTTPSLITEEASSKEDYDAMSSILTSFAQRLAQLVVRDGEGATKFVQVTVRHAPSHHDARAIASTIARSPLVKTALYGKDANWGRILCAIGYTPDISPDAVVPTKTNVSFVPAPNSKSKDEGVLKLLVNGEPESVDEERAARLLEDEDLHIEVDLGTGQEEANYWFCDFSHEYVTINGDYRT